MKPISGEQLNPVRAVASLESLDLHTRERARRTLAALGKASLPHLHQALNHPAEWVRWEAASTLGMIADPASAPALVRSLHDESPSVRLAACEALTAIGSAAVRPLSQELDRSQPDAAICQEAHRILHALYQRNQLGGENYALYAWLHGLSNDETRQ